MAKISDYVEVRNSKIASRYAKDKVQAGQWVEDYMKGDDTIINSSLLSLFPKC